MAGKLKLGPILDDRPVRLAVELPAETHRTLQAYAEALKQETGAVVEPAKLAPIMVARFMESDRGFMRGRARVAGSANAQTS